MLKLMKVFTRCIYVYFISHCDVSAFIITDLVISVPADVQATHSARPSRQRNWGYLFISCCIWKLITYTLFHYSDVIMGRIASQITSLTIVYSTIYSDAAQRKHQSSASLAFVWVIHRWPVNSPHKCPVMRKLFPFDDVIMFLVIIRITWRRTVETSWHTNISVLWMESFRHRWIFLKKKDPVMHSFDVFLWWKWTE